MMTGYDLGKRRIIMTRSLLAGACGLAFLLLTAAVGQAQTQTPAAQLAPSAEKPAADQGTGAADASDDDKQAPVPFEGGQLTNTAGTGR